MTEKKRPEIKEIKKLTDSRFLNMYELDAVDRKADRWIILWHPVPGKSRT